MTNFELTLEFEKIFAMPEALDAFMALRQLKKEYKKSEFYKTTKLSLEKAYSIFELGQVRKVTRLINRIPDVEYISGLLTEYLNGIDSNTIEQFLNNIINSLNLADAEDLKGELQTVLKSLKG